MKDTKRAKLWQYVKKHGSISTWEGIECAAYTRTSAWIAYLKSKGIKITTEDEFNNGTKYTRYFIAPDEIKKAEENKWVNY